MSLPDLRAELASATSTIDLARRLVLACMPERGLLLDMERDLDPAARRHWGFVEDEVAGLDHAAFERPSGAGFLDLLEHEALARAVDFTRGAYPMGHYAFLRGLCRSHLLRAYERADAPLQLEYGTPFPVASRPVNDQYGHDLTPFHTKLAYGSLLARLGFSVFAYQEDDWPPVLLDYRHRERLDALTWLAERRLPRIGTLHPCLGREHRRASDTSAGVFEVGPAVWDLPATLAQLEQLRAEGAEVALLPELCLPAPDALEEAIGKAPERYPPLVVAGSAHVHDRAADGREIRANESRVYLDGALVLAHRKIRPLDASGLGDAAGPIREDLTSERKPLMLLSGEHTRLGVVICSDLISTAIPRLLEAAGTNLLLVPAMTYREGSFNGAVCGIASDCQGVTVVANADLEPFAQEDGSMEAPFLLMAGVPRPRPQEQSREYRDGGEALPPRALVDPNLRLDRAVRWLGDDAQA
ncbi:MAG TPA: hypothetical protein VFS37_12850 [Conexibacter sp.]|nr:hypothetical protein [Conexibacter sp.]